MGYNSQVVFAVNKPTLIKYGLLLKKLNILDEISNNTSKLSSTGAKYWLIDSIRWYESYEDIAEVTALMDTMDSDEDTDIIYGFMRVGEDSGDVDDRGQCSEFEIYYSQSIDSPYYGII